MVVVKKTVVSAPTLSSSSSASSGGTLTSSKGKLSALTAPTSGTAAVGGRDGSVKNNKQEMSEVEKKRGVLIEQGQDALEVSVEKKKELTLVFKLFLLLQKSFLAILRDDLLD